MIAWYEVHDSYATVGAREDIDGALPVVVLCPNRSLKFDEQVELEMTPRVARMLARRLNRWAKLVSSK